VLRHRVATNFQAQAEGMDSDSIVSRLLDDVKPPEPEKLAPKAS
jgi:MoxR-like ATPase